MILCKILIITFTLPPPPTTVSRTASLSGDIWDFAERAAWSVNNGAGKISNFSNQSEALAV